jgi:hypothetical protein
VAQQVMRGEHAWLETGIISLGDDETSTAASRLTGIRTVQTPQPV